MIVGIALGLLIGAITGTVFLLLLRSARLPTTATQKLITLTAELLAIPTFMLGGPWLSTKILQPIPISEFINPYLISLSFSFFIFCGYPAVRWIRSLADELGSVGGQQ